MPNEKRHFNFSNATFEELQADIDRLSHELGQDGLSLALAVSEAERRRLAMIYLGSLKPIGEQITEAAKSRALTGLLAAPAVRAQPDESKPLTLSPETLAVINDMSNSVLRAELMLKKLNQILNEQSEIVGRELAKVSTHEARVLS